MKPAEHSFSDTNLWAWCPHFDHHDPTLTHANAYQIYEHLRHECPVAWSDRYDGFWVVSRYADIVTALMDPVTFSSAQGVHIPRQEGQMKSIPIDYDPPIHTQYRKIFNDALNLRLIRSREPFIHSVIVGLLAPITAKGGGELVSELAIHLPIQVISGMLGLKEHTTSRIRTITEQVWMAFGKERDPAPLQALFALLMDEVNERRISP